MADKGLNYIAVTDSKTGELLGFVSLTDGETIQAEGVDIRMGYGEPEFIERDGKVFMKVGQSEQCLPEKGINNMTLKELFVNAANGAENCKVILGIRMPDGTKEIIINDNVQNKVDYVCVKYDDDLKMIGVPIFIEEFLFIKKQHCTLTGVFLLSKIFSKGSGR